MMFAAGVLTGFLAAALMAVIGFVWWSYATFGGDQ